MPTATTEKLWGWLVGAALSGAASIASSTPVPARSPEIAVAAVVDGPTPGFTFVRGSQLFTGERGVDLAPGDFLTTAPASLLVLELKTDQQQHTQALVAIGPSTRAYWMTGTGDITFAVLEGWIKVDTRTPKGQVAVEARGRRLRASSPAGSFVAHVSDSAEEIFDEDGALSLRPQPADGQIRLPSRADQLTRQVGGGPIQTRLGADAEFLDQLPPAFRDPLPTGLADQLRGVSEPQLVRDVTYGDVADWLAAPREWRHGFIRRFRGRLADPAFRQALDEHLKAHPEWRPILYPPLPRE